MEDFRKSFIEKIDSNVKEFGHHITLVNNVSTPRFAYTIGTNTFLNIELIFAGGIVFMENEVYSVINEVVSILKVQGVNNRPIKTSLGIFKIDNVHPSWAELTMLGLYDYYQNKAYPVFQIIPIDENYTLDVPDMSVEWNVSSQPVWQWLSKDWNYDVPENSKVITNINALKGQIITEVMRWELDEWEAFAGSGPDVNPEDIRVISLATIIGIDISMDKMLKLEVGKGIWRDTQELVWNDWN